jgi:ubiquinone/menaquinone biosynthesis C-methylase UbiE
VPKAFSDNVAGHMAKYEVLSAQLPPDQVGTAFVGGSDPILMGFYELELIRRYAKISGASVVDIGCGIGRLTRHMMAENVGNYLGTDVVPQILQEAIDMAKGDKRFHFKIANDCVIPQADCTADIVVAFSVITHLIDEEAFEYFAETKRVLKPGGLAIFSFLDFMNTEHRESFFRHAEQHRHGHGDMLKFTTAEILQTFIQRLGVSLVEFVDGALEMPISGEPSPVLDVTTTVQTFRMGQSACVFKR